MNDWIDILVQERPARVRAGTTLYALRAAWKPGADVMILNGASASGDQHLKTGDTVVLIRRGEIPHPEELDALMAARHTPGVHAVVKRATVGIAGLGGLGSSVAFALARLGVGKLVLADFDVVEPSNLNRQQYFVDQIGLPKVAALSATLVRIAPALTIEGHELRVEPSNVDAIFGAVDVLVEALDAAESKAMLAETFARLRPEVPLVVATGLAGHASSNTIVTRQVGRSLVVVGDAATAAGPGVGLMAPRVGIAAHHQANAVLRLLLGEAPEGGKG